METVEYPGKYTKAYITIAVMSPLFSGNTEKTTGKNGG